MGGPRRPPRSSHPSSGGRTTRSSSPIGRRTRSVSRTSASEVELLGSGRSPRGSNRVSTHSSKTASEEARLRCRTGGVSGPSLSRSRDNVGSLSTQRNNGYLGIPEQADEELFEEPRLRDGR